MGNSFSRNKKNGTFVKRFFYGIFPRQIQNAYRRSNTMLPLSPLSLALRRREPSSRYRIRSRFFAIAVLLFSCAVFCACSSEDKKRGQENPEQKYPKLRNYTLDLSIISTRGNYRRSDVNPLLRFSVRNAGANQLSIHEWKMFISWVCNPHKFNIFVIF